MDAERDVPSAENAHVADRLRQAAELLQAQGASPFRIAAYRRAADTIEAFPGSLRSLLETQGREGLEALPGVGTGIATAIAEMLHTGRWGQLDRLRGSVGPASLFRTVPGIGAELAERIHEALGVETLEALEAAAHDGRLAQVPGVGLRRVAAIRAALAAMLGRPRFATHGFTFATPDAAEPSVAMLLDVDREYRERAEAGSLPTVAPRRFNPEQKSWLPILHAARGDWHFTALFSNTARAHELGRTHDWVVVYFYDGDHVERQRTVVTEHRGPLDGQRVVRGREAECATFHAAHAVREAASPQPA